ncbi:MULTISPECIES: hypothetical protein [Clostridiaceae]|uniref:Uncharacterized protein n=1 Tax=Clostridium facile TaxID=2763035 RepID=A0ABR7IP65_9CLOT|nr:MULTISPECIES: hypothetical protein [Clostridiaceae]MBC5786922.1 hypothetical protein [Clostridium facile]
MNVIAIANHSHTSPSQVMGIDDPYTAYCFDETCLYISQRMERGDRPRYLVQCNGFREFYDRIQGR